MTDTESHETVVQLIGAWALDACSATEAELVEVHLSTCRACAREARELREAAVDERGVTIGLTQKEAYALDDRARSSARLANVLFGVAGVATIAGGTFWILGTRVEVAATPAGVTVGGELP